MKTKIFSAVAFAYAFAASAAPVKSADSIDAALALAKEDNAVVMMNFTGTDWCTACIHLKENVLSTPAFAEAYGGRIVMTAVDFPRLPELRAKISKAEARRREELLNSYQIKGLPTAVLLDAAGLPFAMITGSRPTPAEYMKVIDEAFKVRKARDEAFAKASPLRGMERAKALAAALELLPKPCRGKYKGVVKEINLLDPGNTLGYRDLLGKSEAYIKQMNDFRALADTFRGHFDEPSLRGDIKKLEEFLKTPNLEPDIRQLVYRSIGDSYAFMRNDDGMLKAYEDALKASPETKLAANLRSMIEYTRKRMEAMKKEREAKSAK